MSKEAIKLAIEAMQYADACLKKQLTTKTKHEYAQDLLLEAAKALEEALKQEQGEPLCTAAMLDEWFLAKSGLDPKTPLYTTPQQRKPLTDEMIVAGGKALAKLHADTCGLDFDDVWKYYAEDHKADAKAVIEAAHGIKE